MKFLLNIFLFFVEATLNLIDRVLYLILFLIYGNEAVTYDLRAIGTDKFKVKAKTVEGAEEKPGETKPYRNAAFPNLMETPVQGIETMSDLFSYCVKKHGKKRCVGQRPVKAIHTEYRTEPDGTEKQWFIPEFGDMEWETYEMLGKRVENIASGIVQLTKLNSGDKFAIFEETCKEWIMVAQALFKYGIIVVTVYANLGEDGLLQAFNETEITAVFTNEKQVANFKRYAKKIPTLKYIICNERGVVKGDPSSSTPNGSQDNDLLDSNKNVIAKEIEKDSDIKITSLNEVERLGSSAALPPKITNPPTNDSLALIMYTSGTTGKPKGVMITHKNILASIAGVQLGLGDDPSVEVIYIGYLPLAHILEMVAEHFCFIRGGSIGYGSPKTLTEKGARPIGDILAVAPSVMAGVPRVYDTVKKGGRERVEKSGLIAQWLFKAGYKARRSAIKVGRDTPLWNYLIFNKFRKLIGGRIQMMMSGGAPLSESSHEFMRVCVGCPIVQGYGLTETCAALTLQNGYHEYSPQRVGPPVACAEVKLVSAEDMGYSVNDKPNPRGEVCVRGPNVTKGYYKQEDKTAEVFKTDGWFHTGDIGEIHPDGSLSIIDRIKNLVKLDNGEYIALEKLESIYSNSPFVAPNGICVFAEGSMVVALVIPQVTYLTDWAKKKGITMSESVVELCKNKDVRKAVFESILSEGKKNKLRHFEEVRDVALVTDEWTPENGCLTAAQKLKRNVIAEKYRDQIRAMYRKQQ